MVVDNSRTAEGWSEYANSILSKLSELHQDSQETRKSIDELKLVVEKLKINQELVIKINDWKDNVMEVWSPKNMAEAREEIYIQKSKWATVYGVILAIQVVWILILAYLKTF